MKKKYYNTLLALLTFAALWGSVTLLDRYKSRAVSKSEAKKEEKLILLDSAHIRSFTIKPRTGQAFTCRREGKDWAIVDPKKLSADQSTVSSFLSTLTSAGVEEVVDARPANLKDFGLDSPATTIEVGTDTKPEKLTLLLGDETPTSGGLYAAVAGNPRVVTLASYVKGSLEKNLFDVRDRRALTLDAEQLHRIEVESKGKRWTLEKNPEGVWDLVLPPPVRADRFAVDGLVSQLRNASMQSVVAEDKKPAVKYGFGSPELKVKVSGPSGSQTLVLGKKDGERYDAMNSALDPIFTLNSDFLTQFRKDPADLRDKELFSFYSYDVKRLEVETAQGKRVFEKQKDNWKETTPKTKDEPAAKIEALLDRLRDFRANSFPKGGTLASFGLTHPAYRFMVQFGDKNQKEAVEAAKFGDHVYARRSTDPVPSELAKSALDAVEKALHEIGQ